MLVEWRRKLCLRIQRRYSESLVESYYCGVRLILLRRSGSTAFKAESFQNRGTG